MWASITSCFLPCTACSNSGTFAVGNSPTRQSIHSISRGLPLPASISALALPRQFQDSRKYGAAPVLFSAALPPKAGQSNRLQSLSHPLLALYWKNKRKAADGQQLAHLVRKLQVIEQRRQNRLGFGQQVARHHFTGAGNILLKIIKRSK
jgi:hypothetical protein